MIMRKQLLPHIPDAGIIGDCFRTCIACLLDMEPQDVPHWSQTHWDGNGLVLDAELEDRTEWLASKGYALFEFPFVPSAFNTFEGMAEQIERLNGPIRYIVNGKGASGCQHVVIYEGSKMVWDPSPIEGGLVGPGLGGAFWIIFILPISMKA